MRVFVINYLMTMWLTHEIELSLQSRAHVCRPHVQKAVSTHQFFLTIFIWNRALATVSCTFCRPHRPKVAWARQFFTIFSTVSCTFCRPHLPKVVWWSDASGFTKVKRCLSQIELWIQSRANFVGHVPGSSHATAETETLQRRPRTATLPEKKRISRPRVYKARMHTFPIAHMSQLLDDDVVDMMVGQLAMTIVRNSEVS